MNKPDQFHETGKMTGIRSPEAAAEPAARREIEENLIFKTAVLDNVKDSVIAVDREGKVIYWNRGASAIFGYSCGEMFGKSITVISRSEEGESNTEDRRAFLLQHTPVTTEWEGVNKEGSTVYLLLTYLPMPDKEGRTVGLIHVGKDITERKKAEEALQASEIRYRRLFEAAKDGVLLLDADTGQITDVNPYLMEKLKYTKEEFVSKKIWEIGAFKDTEISKAGFRELQEKGYIHYESMPLAAKDGSFIEVEFVSNVYLVEGSKVIQCNIRDITERKKIEKALRESEEKLMEQNVLLEQKNAALREIMNQHRDEKERMEKQIQANVEHLLMPIIEKLKGKGSLLAERYTSLLEANLNEMTSGFGKNISSRMFSLTRKEIDICNMIKTGFSSKQISEAMNISTRTIETHRNNIRKKLDISGKEVNLETYLKNLP